MTEDLGNIESRGMQHHRWVEKEAAGVVAAIIAYNYPNQLALAKLAPALAAGCTVVLKAAPDTPLITLALGELIADHTDIPAGVVNVLSGADPDGRRRADHQPRRRHGHLHRVHPDRARAIMAAASETLKKVFLELGGKSAAIVLDDADFNTAALFSAFSMVTHAGQGCALTSRLLVPKKHKDEIVELIKNNFGLVRYGDPSDPGTYMGPLISEKQRDKVDGMVQRAVAAGATLVTGGEKVDPGYFYTPDAARRRRPGQRDRPGGGVRTGARRDRLRGRRRRGADRQQLDLRTLRAPCSAARTGRWRWPAGSAPARSRSTAATTSAPTARSAGTSSRASAARWAGPGSRSSWRRKTFAPSCPDSLRRREPGHEPPARRNPGPRGRDVRLRPVGGCGARRVGRRRRSRSNTPSPATRSAACARPGLLRVEGDPNPNIEHANRGKRSIGLDMSVPEGREVLLELARRADVFLTSFLPGHREKFGIDVDDIRAVNPQDHLRPGQCARPARARSRSRAATT